MNARQTYIVTLTTAPGWDAVPVHQRLKRTLKCLLRSFGLRCTRRRSRCPPQTLASHRRPGPTCPRPIGKEEAKDEDRQRDPMEDTVTRVSDLRKFSKCRWYHS